MATIYKRGKTWWGRVERQGRELRQSLKTPFEGVARKRLKAWVDALDAVAWGEKPRRTFDDLALKFIDEYLPALKPTSRDRYIVSIEAMTDTFEGLYLDQLTSGKLAEFESARRAGGHRVPERWRGRRKPKALSPASIRRDLACLSAMFGYAIDLEWCDANPVPAYLKRGKRRGLKESPPRRNYLHRDDEPRLLAAARDPIADPNLYDAICLAIDTGLRREEQFALLRPGAAPPDGEPAISRANPARNQVEVLVGTSKNSKARNVPLLPRSRAILDNRPVRLKSPRARRRAAQLSAQLRPLLHSPYVFTNPESGTRYDGMNKGLAGACKRAGIPRLTWQDLRRTCGCRRLQDDRMSIEEVSRWLGHSSIEVTQRVYAFIEDEQLHEAAARAAGRHKTRHKAAGRRSDRKAINVLAEGATLL